MTNTPDSCLAVITYMTITLAIIDLVCLIWVYPDK